MKNPGQKSPRFRMGKKKERFLEPTEHQRWITQYSTQVDTDHIDMNATTKTGLPDILTLEDLAEYLRCSERHIQNLTRFGLPHFYLGSLVRFRSAEVLNFLATHNRIGRSRQRRVATEGTAL